MTEHRTLQPLRLGPDWSSWVVIFAVLLLVGAFVFYLYLFRMA